MPENDQLELLRRRSMEIVQRRKAIAEQVKALTGEDSDLAKEHDDLLIAGRVLAKLLNKPERAIPEPPAPPKMARPPLLPPSPSKRGKPPGIPTVFEMADAILEESEKAGQGEWMEGSEILAGIQKRWWPDAKTTDIVPTLWRLAQHDRLRKEGTKYARARVTQQGDLLPAYAQ